MEAISKLIRVEHELYVVPDSEAEKFIAKEISPKCEGVIKCRLGGLFGEPYNTYVLTHKDYIRCKNEIEKLKGM